MLIRVGIANKAARIGFFTREFAGDKGGACEFFNSGGDWWEVSFAKPRAVLREIPKGWSPDLRADFIRGNLRVLIRCMDELGFDPIDTELLLQQVIDADGGETTAQPQGDGYRIAGIRVHTSTSVTENKFAWLICQRFTWCDMARQCLFLIHFSAGRSTTGETQIVIKNYVDTLIADRSLVVVGSA